MFSAAEAAKRSEGRSILQPDRSAIPVAATTPAAPNSLRTRSRSVAIVRLTPARAAAWVPPTSLYRAFLLSPSSNEQPGPNGKRYDKISPDRTISDRRKRRRGGRVWPGGHHAVLPDGWPDGFRHGLLGKDPGRQRGKSRSAIRHELWLGSDQHQHGGDQRHELDFDLGVARADAGLRGPKRHIRGCRVYTVGGCSPRG